MTEGFIKLHRKLIEWEWFSDINTTHLFLYCLLRANYEDKKWRGIDIRRGSFITSLDRLSKDTGLTVRQVRTALDKLKSTGELTSKTTSQYSIISIKNYNLYQDNDKQIDNPMTSERQTNDKRMTTDKNIKNNKNNKNIKEKKKLGEFLNVLLTEEEEEKLKELYGNNYNDAIETLSNYIQSKGDKYKDHYAVLRKNNWVYEKVMQEQSIAKGGYQYGF